MRSKLRKIFKDHRSIYKIMVDLFMDYSLFGKLSLYFQSIGKPNAVFIWIPKNAGTSIHQIIPGPKLKMLRSVKYRFINKGVVTFGHMDYAELVNQGYISKKFDESSFKFAFSRNPYDRAVSLFNFLKSINKIDRDQTFLSFCQFLSNKGCEEIGLYNSKGLSQCNPQVRWVENVDIDFIGKVENISSALTTINEKLNLEYDTVPTKNSSNIKDYESYYCKKSKNIIEKFYREDFERFNYDYK